MAIAAVVSALYLAFAFLQWYGWKRTPVFVIPGEYEPSVKISVIIPARNEERNIRDLIAGLLRQEYPEHLLEIILVDDHSTDRTFFVAQEFSSPVLNVLRSYNPGDRLHKKRALETGIAAASGELIVTTDADCAHPPQWVKGIAAFYETYRPRLVLAPVCYREPVSALQHFQQLEFSALMMTTAASVFYRRPVMANGANMAYARNTFAEVNGYENDRLASGDDVSLLSRIRMRYGSGSVRFIRSAGVLVETEAAQTWKELIGQRTRWASKNLASRDLFSFLLAGCLAAYIFLLPVSVIVSVFNPELFYVPLALFILKTGADSLLFITYANFSGRKAALWYIVWSELLYIPYLPVILYRSLAGVYEWKGRTIRDSGGKK